ncbi:hypothetical protein FDO65_19765 [Nakamurella flava]|uniref:DUF3885 domain-containing protein n=1 Tax=Nakamurella flava TaxID=2576308 RepID=A0A4U6QAS8_9ACTN|nr:hypothetical protein [Nakamurella flava]TKV57051.1 hypothetical protein FDO65_19765 [Nakamurella flava]
MTDDAESSSPFSVVVAADGASSRRPTGEQARADLRRGVESAVTVLVWGGSLHETYPGPVDPPPLAVVGDPAAIARLAAALTSTAASADDAGPGRLSDVVLELRDGADEWLRWVTIAGGRVGDNRSGTGWPVDADVVAAALAHAGVPDGYLPRDPDPRRPPAPDRAPQGAALTRMWMDRLPGSRPVSHELRTALADRWVRFHSLPESRRYAADEADHREIVRRHRAVLAELAGLSGTAELLLITAAWSGGLAVPDRPAPLTALTPQSWLWDSIVTEVDEGEPRCLHLWVETTDRDDPRLDPILRMVADEVIVGVILADPELRWLFAPYDGGVDVIAADPAERDRLAARFGDWLPAEGRL